VERNGRHGDGHPAVGLLTKRATARSRPHPVCLLDLVLHVLPRDEDVELGHRLLVQFAQGLRRKGLCYRNGIFLYQLDGANHLILTAAGAKSFPGDPCCH